MNRQQHIQRNQFQRNQSGQPDKAQLESAGMRMIWSLAWPTIAHTLMFNLVQLWSIRMVGPLGAEAVAAVSTGQRVVFLAQGAILAIATGAAAMVARSWGAGAHREAGRTTMVSVELSVFFGIGSAALIWLLAPWVARLFLHEELAIAQTEMYLQTLAPWMVSLSINLVISSSLRACGDVLWPLSSALVMAAVNVPLVYLWTQGLLGFPMLGSKGVALAAGIGLTASTVFMVLVWLLGRTSLPLVPLTALRHHRTRVLINLGWPAAAEQLVLHGGLNLFVLVIGLYGTAPYSAYGVGVSILALSFLIGLGFSIAGATLVGQSLGAGEIELAKRHGWRTMWLCIGCMSGLGLGIIVWAEQIAAVFQLDSEITRHTVSFIYFLGSMQPLMAIEFSLGGAFRGAGDTKTPLVITVLGLLLVRLTLAFVALQLGMEVHWVYACLLADYIVKGAAYVYRFRAGHWIHAMDRAAGFGSTPAH